MNQVTVKYGSGPKGFNRLKGLLLFLLDNLLAGANEDAVVSSMAAHRDFSFLQPKDATSEAVGRDFAAEAKSAVFLRDALQNPLRCGICGGLVHRNAISIDHVVRKEDGGMGDPDNGQLTHPYCNTTVKN